MKYTSCLTTRLTGLAMAGSASLSPIALPLMARDAPREDRNHPLLGIFTILPNHPAICYCSQPDLETTKNIKFITTENRTGSLQLLQPITEQEKNWMIAAEACLPGEPYNKSDESQLTYYCGIYNLRQFPTATSPRGSVFDPTNELPVIGFLLDPKCKITSHPSSQIHIVKFNNNKFIIRFYDSSEGVHFVCQDPASKKELAHFYYYLGYEIEPEDPEPDPNLLDTPSTGTRIQVGGQSTPHNLEDESNVPTAPRAKPMDGTPTALEQPRLILESKGE